ncbi:hypothetical protein C8J30_103135 [Rhodobacter viridis]|uniref:Sulfotransferase family protein n=1 Tax=Rhodobacter viridis TaxID=1054202 RepID=A0A318U331_9RHOB|nr:hypothetical protein [Rhodobacter viridis]PYF11040.1 hypothetical protein C8J30_103135 [Rhodobacter viridis]
MQVFLHLGFHKTGTSSAQMFLHENRELIWPRAALVLPGRIREVAHAVFAHHYDRDATSLAAITAAMRAFLGTMTLGPNRRILISSENLLGPMPRGVTPAPYPDAAAILRALIAGFAHFDWPVQVTLYLSTRAQGPWVDSLWAHQVRKDQPIPFTEDLESFRARMNRVSQGEQLDILRRNLAGVKLVTQDLSGFDGLPFGAGQPFLDFLALTPEQRAAFQPVFRRNVSPPRAVTEALLALNRQGLGEAELAAAKRALLAEAGAETMSEEDEA